MQITPDLVSIGGQSIPVSRKYKDSVKAVLAEPQEYSVVYAQHFIILDAEKESDMLFHIRNNGIIIQPGITKVYFIRLLLAI